MVITDNGTAQATVTAEATENAQTRRIGRGGLVTLGTVVALVAAMGLTVLGLGVADHAVASYDASSWLWSSAKSEIARVNGVTGRVDTRVEVAQAPPPPDAGDPDRPVPDPARPVHRPGQLAGPDHAAGHRDHEDHRRARGERRPARGRRVRRRRRAGHRAPARPAHAEPGRRAGALSRRASPAARSTAPAGCGSPCRARARSPRSPRPSIDPDEGSPASPARRAPAWSAPSRSPTPATTSRCPPWTTASPCSTAPPAR